MRERLVAALVGLTVLVIALYGIPRAYFLADLVRSQEQDRVDRSASLVAMVLTEHSADGQAITPEFLDRLAGDGESIVVTPTGGVPISGGRPADADDGDVWATTSIGDIATVTLTRDAGAVDDEVAQALLPLVVLGLLLIVLAIGVGLWLARRMSRPFTELASAARDLGAGNLKLDLPTYRVPEAQEIALALTRSGERLDALVQHERELAVHASHELRTPVTALRLELEDLALDPGTSPDVAIALRRSVGELDRLSAAIGELLATSRDLAADAEIDLDLDALIADTLAKRPAGAASVTHVPVGVLPTHVDPAPVIQALEAVFVDGSVVEASDRDTHLEISVSPAAADLAEAADLIAVAGGHLARSEHGALVRIPKRPLTSAGS